MQEILEVCEVSKGFKDFALERVTLSLEPGYVMGFIGPNGAGKTTTIKLIMNLIKRDSGEIKIFGLDNIQNERDVKQRIGFVYDEPYFYEELTIREMKGIIAPHYDKWDDNEFNILTARFALRAGSKIKTLSRGTKMKLSLAVALSHHAELIIMDEPTAGLDPVFRNEILDILRELIQDSEKAVLFSTHITTDLDKIADFITFINKGRIVLSGSKEAVLDTYAIVKGGRELLDNDTIKEFIGIRENSFGFEALTRDVGKARAIFQDCAIIERPSLEDIMLYTVKGESHV